MIFISLLYVHALYVYECINANFIFYIQYILYVYVSGCVQITVYMYH